MTLSPEPSLFMGDRTWRQTIEARIDKCYSIFDDASQPKHRRVAAQSELRELIRIMNQMVEPDENP